ncbi:MAG: glycosyltransferase family 1 protein, partial [Chitinophagaceae bacterium]
LYLGDAKSTSTSLHRAQALQRIGHTVVQHDPGTIVQQSFRNPLLGHFHYRTGFRLVASKVEQWLAKTVLPESGAGVDAVWVNSGQFFSPAAVRVLKGLKVPVILYNNDDPTGGRDPGCWHQLLKALPEYDLCVSLRHSTVREMAAKGAPRALRVWMSYDEVLHTPPGSDERLDGIFQADVVFVGTWMRHENRHVFLRHLVNAGVKVRIWGDRWNKCEDTALVGECWTGKRASGRDYVYAVAGAKAALGLLSKGNRDLHTRRSVEIPFAGGVFCAERTSEHGLMYKENEDAVFWSTAEECAEKCLELVADSAKRESIRLAGMARVRAMHLGNEDVCRAVMDEAFNPSRPKVGEISPA